jgi:hypothetical protein
MTDRRKRAKDGPNSDPMKEMRDRYERAVEADRDNRESAVADLQFVTIPGHTWDEEQRKARKGRACYEFPILRSHWRQVVNDQKKARPGIKVRAVEDGDSKGAELRQGLIRNIESVSNAERAYDRAFELITAAGMGSWRVTTKYSTDDAWDQDLRIQSIQDPLTSVWHDPDAKEPDLRDQRFCFVEEAISRDEFKRRWPDAQEIDFESSGPYDNWFAKDTVRIAEYWRLEPVTKQLLLLSDGRTVDKADLTPEAVQQMMAEGVTVTRERACKSHKVVMSIVSGAEELEGPLDTVFDRIPIVSVFANRFYIEGRWHWCGMVRFSRDPQKLINYNLTTAQEVVAKQPKAPYLLTPKMLEGAGVKGMWDRSNSIDAPYLPYTPDPQAPQGRPVRESPPDMPAAFTMLTQISVDMLKASDGIFDASVGAKSNETSGKAIIARQREGDTATFDYQDALSFGIQTTGEILLAALPKVYDTPRMIRVLGKDGAEDLVAINNGDGVSDLSVGKYDVTVTRERACKSHKVVMSIVSGAEELEGPLDTVFDRIPIVSVFANRFYIEGRWHWCGMVRFSRDPQKLINYNLTTAQEVVAKQPKAPYLLTPKMLEGAGVKGMWDRSNSIDAPYLPYTPDPQAPQGRPVRESPPDMPAAFTMLTQISVDMLKASDGIFDASVGAKSNETSGKAIIARQREGDTATFDYQDALSFGIQSTGEILLAALPKVYDTPRMIRVLGKDGAEDLVAINNGDGVSDLSVGKYDVTVTTGPSYDTQRMEYVDALTQLSTGNPAIAAGVPDLIVGALDFPKAEEAAERLKLLLPPPILQAMSQGKDVPPQVAQAMQQAQQLGEQAELMMQQAQKAMQEVEQEQAGVGAEKAQVAAQKSMIAADIRVAQADFDKQRAEFETMVARFETMVARTQATQANEEPKEGAL